MCVCCVIVLCALHNKTQTIFNGKLIKKGVQVIIHSNPVVLHECLYLLISLF